MTKILVRRCDGQSAARQGYAVIPKRTGTAPVDQCTVTAVLPGQTFSRTDLRCAWSQRRPRHDRDGRQDPFRRRRVLTELNTRSRVSSICGRGFGVVGYRGCDSQEARANGRIGASTPVSVSCAHNAALMHPITCRLKSIPRWPTPSNVMVSTWACDGTERSPGTMMSSAAVTDSHRTPSGNGAEATRRNSGEPGRSARTISVNGNTPAHGDPPNGDPRVMILSTRPFRRRSAMACAMTTPPKLCPTRCTLSAPVRHKILSTSATS